MTIAAGDAHEFPIYAGRYRVVFPVYDADGDLVTSLTTPDSEVSIDQGTFADVNPGEATAIATTSGMYYLDLTATEMTGKCIAIIVKSATAGMKPTTITLYPKRMPTIRSGTAQAGGASTITLDSGASAKDNAYVGMYVQCSNNSPANVQGQTRKIISYVGSTKVATVEAAWGTNPSSATTFLILCPETVNVNAWLGQEPADPTTNGVPEVDVTHWSGTAVASPHTAGYPVVTVKDGTGTGEIDTTSGGVLVAAIAANAVTATAIAADAITAAKIADGAIDANTFAAGAITASAIAADAIGASELAADAVTEIQSGLATAASISALNNLSAAQVNAEVVDALSVDTYGEPGQGTPSATLSIAAKIGYLFKAWRNRTTQTATEYALYADDATTKDQKAVVSDNGTTFERGEVSTGA